MTYPTMLFRGTECIVVKDADERSLLPDWSSTPEAWVTDKAPTSVTLAILAERAAQTPVVFIPFSVASPDGSVDMTITATEGDPVVYVTNNGTPAPKKRGRPKAS